MLVSEYLNFVVNGEVKPLAISDVGDLSCSEEDSPLSPKQKNNRKVLIDHLNLANLEVHKKFSLIQKEILVDLDCSDDTKLYDIPLDFLHVVYAQLPNGVEVPINNEYRTPYAAINNSATRPVDTRLSILFPAPFKMRVKGVDVEKQDRLVVICAAAPPKLVSIDDFLDISSVFTDAILNFIAYRCYASIKGDMQATNNTFYMRFIESCNSIKISGLNNSDNLDSNRKLDIAGFV